MTDVLAIAWFILIGFCIIMYVLLDGFDLGIGILMPFFPQQHDRNIMVSTVLPVWDGNQTWLVLGGASLYGAFPLAFSLLLPALYLPIFLMVIALLFRGITFEFRLKSKKGIAMWDRLFFLSSTAVAFTQGLVLGSFVDGFTFKPGNEALQFQLLTPFNLTCGIALVFGYALLGSTWIIAKTSGDIQKKMFKVTRVCLVMVTLFMGIVSLWTPFIETAIRDIWFNPHYFYKLAFLPLMTGLLIVYFFYSLYRRAEYILFWLAQAMFICGYIGFGISTFPYLVPRIVTVWQAAAPGSSLLFMLFGALLLLPVLVGYTSYSYYIFRGKVTKPIEY